VLGQLETMNAAIGEVGTIVQAQEKQVLPLLDPGQLSGAAGYADVTAAADQVRAQAKQLTGLGYATYARLRAQAVAEAFATSVTAELGFPAESNRASFVAAVFCAWARRRTATLTADPAALEVQLGAIDVPFRLLSRQSGAAADLTGPLRSALEAILDTERDGLSHIGPVVQALTAQAGQITTMGPNGPT
jgi:hypothetical protein